MPPILQGRVVVLEASGGLLNLHPAANVLAIFRSLETSSWIKTAPKSSAKAGFTQGVEPVPASPSKSRQW